MSYIRPQAGPEVDHPHSGIEPTRQAAVYPDQGPQLYEPLSQRELEKATNGDVRAAALPPDPRVCGLSRKTFVILVAVSVVIIAAAALGGGLGGGLSRYKNAAALSQQAPTFSTPTSPTGTTSANASITSVTAEIGTVSGTSVTLYRDCPSSNNSLYSVQYSSTTYEFRKLCNMQFINPGVQNVDWVNQPTSNLNDCVNLCTAWNENNVTKSNADQVCSAVCWRYGFNNDDLPGYCFGFTLNNSSTGSFDVQSDPLCDSAAWINQT
jgi:hypothetical protein